MRRNCTGDAERGRHGASGPCQVGFCRKPLSGKLFFRHLATVPTMKFSVDPLCRGVRVIYTASFAIWTPASRYTTDSK